MSKKSVMDKKVRELTSFIGDLKIRVMEQQKVINRLERENKQLIERQGNCDRNREFIDDATNWLGPMTNQALNEINQAQEALTYLRKRMEGIHAGYYTVEGKYPWQHEDQ